MNKIGNKKGLLFVFVFALLLITSNVSAFFPSTHKYITDESLKIDKESTNAKLCAKRPDLCFSGNLLSDAFVTDYYTNFKRYAVTHTPSFCTAMLKAANTEEEKICAVGACTHQPHDIVSHTEMIPYTIQHTLLPNVLIHPFAEQRLDSFVEKQNPNIDFEKITSSNSYKTCKPLFIRVLSGSPEFVGVDLDAKLDKFIKEIQSSETGYNPSFNNITSLPLSIIILFLTLLLFFGVPTTLIYIKRLRFKERRTILNWVTFVLFAIPTIILLYIFVQNIGGQGWTAVTTTIAKPVSPFVPIGNEQYYLDKAIQSTVKFFQTGESVLYQTDASGELVLAHEDSLIQGKQYVFMFGFLAFIIWLLYMNFRTPKSKGGRVEL